MMYSSPTLIVLRNITRKFGLNRLIGRVLTGSGYEDKFGPAMLAQVRVSDCVWDVGANVGLYTSQFAERTGGKGMVIAFEPVPACFGELQERTKSITTIRPVNVAMGVKDGEIAMALDNEDLAATHRVVLPGVPHTDSGSCTVAVRSAVSVVEEHPEWFPNVIKIDVEGYEGAVFDGLYTLLTDPRLRCIGIEVHFGLLEERGERDRPQLIKQSLTRKGFNVRWTDPSHLIAVR